MRKDTFVIFSISIVLTLGIVGGAHYLYLQKQTLPPNPDISEPQPPEHKDRVTGQAAIPANKRTSKIIECTKPDGSVFWTNAARCEGADLGNTLSIYDSVKLTPRVRTKTSNKSKSRSSSSGASSSERKKFKPIPQNMKRECSFPIGMARKIETRSLNLKLDPSESVWKDSYCRWVCEARVENCENLGAYLNRLDLCPRLRYMSKRTCGTMD